MITPYDLTLIDHRWLVTHDRTEEAVQIIADLEDKDLSDPFVQLQMNQIQYSVEYEKTNSVSFSDILRGKAHEKAGTKTVRRLLLGMTAQAMQQFSGINVTSYYLPTVLTKSVGLDESLARLLTACNSVQYLLFSLIGIPNVERWGRRMLMIFGATGMCFCYIFITALIRYNEMPGYAHSQEVASASVAFFFLYYVFFGIGMQGVPWCMSTPSFILSSLPHHNILRGHSILIDTQYTRPKSTPSRCEQKVPPWAQQQTGSSTSWSSRSRPLELTT